MFSCLIHNTREKEEYCPLFCDVVEHGLSIRFIPSFIVNFFSSPSFLQTGTVDVTNFNDIASS
jgi:hypothetical protein